MKSRDLVAILAMCFLAVDTYSQTNSKTIQFETVALKEAQEAIDILEGQQGPHDFAVSAIWSKRSDLITLCFRNQSTMGWIRNEVRDLPESRFKDDMVLMMLKTESPFWLPDGFVHQGSRSIGGAVVEPFATVARKYLPNIRFDADQLKTRAARLKLARDIETVIAAQSEKPSVVPLETTVPESNTPKSELPSSKGTNAK